MNRTRQPRIARPTWAWFCLVLAPLSMGAKGCMTSGGQDGGGAGSGGSTTAGTTGSTAGTISSAGDGGGTAGTSAAGTSGEAGLSGGGGTGGGGDCVVGGTAYKVGEPTPSIDGCNSCACAEGGTVACTEKACIGDVCGGLIGAGCPDGWFCSFPEEALCGAADQTGNCMPKPEACTDEYNPVCGCDDETYGNACGAASAGVSISALGECGGGGGGSKCSNDNPCPQPACACLDMNEDGICENSCPSFTCVNGECVDSTTVKQCGGFAGFTCEEGQFCNYYAVGGNCGITDGSGVCEETPAFCTKEYVPVCGCDGETYGNACEAASAGVSVSDTGACK